MSLIIETMKVKIAELEQLLTAQSRQIEERDREIERLRGLLGKIAPCVCPGCGPYAKIDEDGCCCACGSYAPPAEAGEGE